MPSGNTYQAAVLPTLCQSHSNFAQSWVLITSKMPFSVSGQNQFTDVETMSFSAAGLRSQLTCRQVRQWCSPVIPASRPAAVCCPSHTHPSQALGCSQAGLCLWASTSLQVSTCGHASKCSIDKFTKVQPAAQLQLQGSGPVVLSQGSAQLDRLDGTH